ncbi:MAG TPA: carboxylesterase family protein [Bryobacteraceae bacterium]|nr:carboxylesterase family protein [Bryobacteraceae bacterium]
MKRLLLCAAIFTTLATAAIDGPVTIDSGVLVGVTTGSPGVRAFKGIPYATPPVGDLRWKPPQPAAHWAPYRNANRVGPVCEQLFTKSGSVFFKGDFEPRSEDCLYLNVWTPAKTASDRLPVMVWIYGGSFTHGSGTEAYYQGENFARKGVILVTFNYRVGAFGFLALPELSRESGRGISGNYGLLDQVAALQWVHRNIAAFGGDPNRVTIFGQSAGAASVGYLIASPLAKGLFARAIGQSGLGAGDFVPLANAEENGTEFVRSLGVHSLAELRTLPASKILEAGGRFHRVIDGYFLTDDPLKILAAGRHNDGAVMVGSVGNEGYAAKPITVAGFEQQARNTYGPMASEFLKVYAVTSDRQADQAQFTVARDRLQAGSRTWARLENKAGQHKAYIYLFLHAPAFPEGATYLEGSASRLGAYHSSELTYVWNSLQTRIGWPWKDYDRKLADIMNSYWSNFAATGDPNGKGLPVWPAYDDTNQQVMVFGDIIGAQPMPDKAGVDFMAAFAAVQRARR